jgi:hypothetical protein
MRLFILYIIYGVFAIVAESTWLAYLPTASYRVDLLIIAVAYLGFSQTWRRAVPVIIVYGTLYDVASSGPFGMALCSYLSIYGLIRLVVSKIAYQSAVSRFGWIAIASLLDKSISAALVFMWGYPLIVPEAMLARAPIQAVINSVVGLALIPFLAWYSELTWDKLFRPKKLVLK